MFHSRRQNYGANIFRLFLFVSFILVIRHLYNSATATYSIGESKTLEGLKGRAIFFNEKSYKSRDVNKALYKNQASSLDDEAARRNVLDLFNIKSNDESPSADIDINNNESEETTQNLDLIYDQEQTTEKYVVAYDKNYEETTNEHNENMDYQTYADTDFDKNYEYGKLVMATEALPSKNGYNAGLNEKTTAYDGTINIKQQGIQMFEEEFLEMHNDHNFGITKTPLDYDNLKICVEGVTCMTFEKYKKYKTQEFMNNYANPFNKSYPPPTLRPYTDDIRRPNPLTMVKDTSMFVDHNFINKELEKEKQRRLGLGDDDVSEWPEVRTVLMNDRHYKIPNIIHFIWFGCHRYKIHHYTSMLSAVRYQDPSLILFHTNCPPNGTYWNAFKNAAKTLKIVHRTPPVQTFGKPLQKVEHQSDVARLQILLEVGGIYMDDDLVILKSLDELRGYDIVLGEENYDALANSIIMASRNSWFLHRWFQEYRSFNGTRWSDSSCFVPWSMWQLFPSTITVVKEKMLRPNWEEIKYLYHELWDWRNNYCIHLFSRFMKVVDGKEERTMQELAVLNTTYGEISRHVIWGNYKIQDISNWLFN